MKTILKISGMSCSACSSHIEKYLNKQDGINSASVNLVMATASIDYNDKLTIDDLNRFIEQSGYKSLGVYDEKKEEKITNNKVIFISLALLLIFLMYISMSHMIKLPVIPFLHMINYPINYGIALSILTIPFIIFGCDILKNGIKNLLHKSPNMDTLVTLGVCASFIYSIVNLILIILGNKSLVEHLYFESIAMMIYFIKLGRVIDTNSKEKTKEAIKELVQITPQSALIKIDNKEKEITIDEVKVGDTLICKPGMKIAVDGTIIKGSSHLAEAFITGESIPTKKNKNDRVIAGSINIDGVIEYKAEKIGPNSTISEIVRLVVEATNTRAPISKLADKVSGYFTPSIMIIASITLIVYLILGYTFNESIIAFVTVLVVACPCALGLATPLAVVASTGLSAKKGILIKSSEILEIAHKCDTIIFDKTGTLTVGNLQISKILNYSKYSNEKIINIIANLESNSTHPIANAFKSDKLIDISSFKNLPGIGINGILNNKTYYVGNNKLFNYLEIKNKYIRDEEELEKEANSIVYLIEDKKVIALIGVKDVVRDNVEGLINSLIKMHKQVIMLSGDTEKTANIIAKSLGIKQVVANVMPKDKEQVIKNLQKNNHKVMMVGDGINDAPSLASASVGISINGGTDIALNSADVILMNDDLSKIIDLINISKKTITIIKQNLFWAFIYNIFMIPIAIGLLKPLNITLTPMLASISMTISSLCVVFNSLRLKN